MKNAIAYVIALTLSVVILFGSYKAEAHSNGDAIAGAAIGFGLGIAAGAAARRYNRQYYPSYGRDYFPTGPAYYPHNYYIPGYGYPAYSHPYFRHTRPSLRYRYNRRHH